LNVAADYPRQFKILMGGTLINSIGSGMVFPFLTLYLHDRLDLSMTAAGVVLFLWSTSSLVGLLLGGSLADQLGRKRLMAFSLCSSAIALLALGLAASVWVGAVATVFEGLLGAMYQPARDAMVADLVESDKRPQAYGLLRITANLGIAIGPAIGGFLASRSYLLAFLLSATATLIFFLVVLLLMYETRPAGSPSQRHESAPAPRGLTSVLSDTPFVVFCAAVALTTVAYSPMMTILPVYMKDQFGLAASDFGWVMTTNAGMVVLLQYPITRATQRFPRLPVIAAGSILYGLGVGSVTLGGEALHFVSAMAVMTVGEMLLTPNATSLAADLAPSDLRGRYMGMLGLAWNFGFGGGPLLGGLIVDRLAPRALWPIMGSLAIVVASVYLLLGRSTSGRETRAVDAT
jgi:MFS family permease